METRNRNDRGTKWIVEDNRLLLDARGIKIFPDANKIYASLFENRPAVEDLNAGIPDYLDNLSFSRYPATVSLQIDFHPSPDNPSGLLCRIVARHRDSQATLEETRSEIADHAIIRDTWFPFAPGALDEAFSLLEDAGVNEPGTLNLRQYLHLRQAGEHSELIEDLTRNKEIHPGINVNPGDQAQGLFSGTLYPYQHDGWQWLSFVSNQQVGGILADEMGLGKTIQIIAVLASPERERVAPSAIIAPGSLLENWKREIARFAPGIKVLVHHGATRTGLPKSLLEYDVVVTSYDTAVRDGALFGMIEWQLVILDEAQAIKNPDTRRAQSIKRLNRQVGIAVTGTPVENRLRDLWSILDFVLPGYLGDRHTFESRYEDDSFGAAQIEPLVSPLMLRRRVSEVAGDLPERIDAPQALLLDDAEIDEYENIRQEIADEYGAAATFVSLAKLRMYCTHPLLLQELDGYQPEPLNFSKYQRLIEILEEIFSQSDKVLVFTSYNRMNDILVQDIAKRFGVFTSGIDGRTEIPERQKIIDRFSAEYGPALLALNPKAAGVGLNITAANHVIHYNLEWNPATEDQASARAYRRGQERPVTIHRLFLAGTVEETINDRLERKREIADSAVVGVTGKDADYQDILDALRISPRGYN